MYKNIFAIILLIYAIFGSSLLKQIAPNPQPAPPISILNIDKPSMDIIDKVQHFSKLISDPTDRAKIALFNYEFACRINSWNTTNQQVNDVYVLAGEIFFQDTLVNKYEGLGDSIIQLMTEIMTDKNHILSNKEKTELHDYFNGIAWVLIQRD